MNRMEGKPRLVDPNPTPSHGQNDPYGFVGKTIAGRYQIEDLLGIGGMAAVYRAKHVATTRTVAVKILKPDLAYTTPQMVEEFLNEAKATANLNHRNIIEVSDADRDENGTTFLVMQYLKGKPLDDVIEQEQPLPFERVAHLFEQICDGVQHAHSNGIIHRDLKPGNIMVMADSRGDEMVKILDFGIAKAMTATAKVSREIGTIYYASPEQLSKGASIDHRSDIYSLGVILFQMLTGAVPFDDDSIEHIIYQKLNFKPPLMRQLRAEIPAPVEEVIQRALSCDPSNRYQDATEMSRAFWRAISLETGALVIDCVDASARNSLAGASVLVNGKYAGQTDTKGYWRQSGMLPRQYLVELESPRYQNWRASIRIDSREEVSVTAEMLPEPKGDLIIACGVAGVRAYLDDFKVGMTDENGRLYVEAVNSGRHQVRLSHSHYLTADSEIEVGIAEQAFLEITLTPRKKNLWQNPIFVIPSLAILALAGVLAYKMIILWNEKKNEVSVPPVTSPSPSPQVSISPKVSPNSTVKTTPSSSPTTATPPSNPAPSAAPVTVEYGISLVRSRRYQEAIDTLTKFPKDIRALRALAEAYQGRNQLQNAALTLEEVIKINSGDIATYMRLGDIYMRLNKYDQAIEKYRMVLTSTPNEPVINYKLCQSYFKRGNSGDYDEAVKKCGHAITNSPDYADAFALIDQAYQKLPRGNEHAKNFYKSRWSETNKKALPIYYQGLAYSRMNQKRDVLKHVRMLEEIGSSLAVNLKTVADTLK